MTPPRIIYPHDHPNVEAPNQYSPAFCAVVRASCATMMNDLKEDIARIENRMFTITLLAITQLLAICGSLVYVILTKVSWSQKLAAAAEIAEKVLGQ